MKSLLSVGHQQEFSYSTDIRERNR